MEVIYGGTFSMSGIRTSCSVMENSLDVGWDRGGNFPRSAMGCR